MPVEGLTHRYVDKALFLALDTCPVYCRFCTRSYAVGIDTDEVEKFHLKVNAERWQKAFEYIASRTSSRTSSSRAATRISCAPIRSRRSASRCWRFRTSSACASPPRVRRSCRRRSSPTSAWTDALTRVVEKGRKLHKEVVLHTHFNHPNEITGITEDAMNKLFERGITVRNQSVLQRGVNDDKDVMKLLVKRLGHVNVHPYYVYQHDLVQGVEDLRTTVQTALDIEKYVRGSTAGFNTPTFVVDAPGGGGKRDAHSYEYYDRASGISVYTAPSVKKGFFLYFDPIDTLPVDYQRRWSDPKEAQAMVDAAINEAQPQQR